MSATGAETGPPAFTVITAFSENFTRPDLPSAPHRLRTELGMNTGRHRRAGLRPVEVGPDQRVIALGRGRAQREDDLRPRPLVLIRARLDTVHVHERDVPPLPLGPTLDPGRLRPLRAENRGGTDDLPAEDRSSLREEAVRAIEEADPHGRSGATGHLHGDLEGLTGRNGGRKLEQDGRAAIDGREQFDELLAIRFRNLGVAARARQDRRVVLGRGEFGPGAIAQAGEILLGGRGVARGAVRIAIGLKVRRAAGVGVRRPREGESLEGGGQGQDRALRGAVASCVHGHPRDRRVDGRKRTRAHTRPKGRPFHRQNASRR